MKKPTLANFVIIIGLLILCVMALTAIYATTRDSSVLLLDESFSDLDENTWRHEIAECTEDDHRFHYATGDGQTGFAADGILHVQRNATSRGPKVRRDVPTECNSCADCSSSAFSARLESKKTFHATSGALELRAKFPKANWMRLRIAIVSNNSEPEEASRRMLAEAAEESGNSCGRVEVILESATERSILKSAVTDDDFHIYEIGWNSEKVTLSSDHKKVDEKTFDLGEGLENFSNATAPITQPFHLSIGVDFVPKFPLPTTDDRVSAEESILEVDYVRLFRIGDKNWKFK